jgi:DNA repair exonuclease SbcCD nuclease subunit
MIRHIAFVTDQHFHAKHDLEETIRVNRWIANDARERGCAATVLGGDLLETRSVPADRNAAAEHLMELADFGPVVGVLGNHELENDCDLFNDLRARHPITLYDRPGVHAIPELGIATACLPWPHLGQLLAGLENASVEEAQNAAREMLRSIVLGLGQGLDKYPDLARIALGHVSISGAKTDHDQPLRGSEFVLSLAELSPIRALIYLLGHIHAQNTMSIGDAPAIYGGAPEHCNFGEPGPKGYTIVTTNGPQLVGFERIPTPVAPMILAEGAFDGFELSNSHAERDVTGADIRFQYRVGVDQRAAGRAAADDVMRDLLARGARSVVLDPVVETETRARAPEVAAAVGHREKLEAHWKNKGFDPGFRREALLLKADILHEATREA